MWKITSFSWRTAVIIRQPGYHAVEAVPEMDVGDAEQVHRVRGVVHVRFERDVCEVDPVRDADGRTSENRIVLREGDDPVDLACERIAETFVHREHQLGFARCACVFGVVRESGNFHHDPHTEFFQVREPPDQRRIRIVVEAHVQEPDSFPADVVGHRAVAEPFFELGAEPVPEVFERFSVEYPPVAAVRPHFERTEAQFGAARRSASHW